jgi:DNA polymerase-3 subunit delta'
MRGQHPDVIELRVLPDKSEISMDQWRGVEAKVQFRALEGERKFIIIDDAELMSASVANACLKTLEEPPSLTHFILIAHDSDRLLPTIRSRCQHIVFGPLPQTAVQQWMATQGVDAAVAARAAQLAQGSFQRAQKLAVPEVLAQLDAMTRDVQNGVTPQQVLTHATALAGSEALPELLDGLALTLRDQLVQKVDRRVLQRLRAIEQASQFIATKGANKELILNELFISLSAS